MDAKDALLVLQRQAGFITGFSCPSALDPNADGFWDSRDALLILQFDAGLVSHLGPLEYTMRITSGTATVGRTTQVEVDLFPIVEPGLGEWTIDVTYDPALLDLDSCAPIQPHAICLPTFSENTVRLSGNSTKGLVGDVQLGLLEFRCESAGKSSLQLDPQVFSEATEGPPRQVNITSVHGSITCTA